MTQIPVSIDPNRLRAVADRVEQYTGVLAGLPIPRIEAVDLTGAAVSAMADPLQVASRLTDLLSSMRDWATLVRRSASAFENVDHDNAQRL